MSPQEMTTAKSRAIRFFGEDTYKQMVFTADCYCLNNHITIPSGGVEELQCFWDSIQFIINESLETH